MGADPELAPPPPLRGPGGGIAPDGQHWIACRPGFFLPVRVLSRLFRRLFLEALQAAFAGGRLHCDGTLVPLRDAAVFQEYLAPLWETEWVVYANPPFGGPAQVFEYLGRYTHRVAIANHRLVDINEGQVRFRWRDYRDHDRQKTMTLEAAEFIRRFLLHVLPPWVPPHPSLRVPRQPPPHGAARPLPAVAGHAEARPPGSPRPP